MYRRVTVGSLLAAGLGLLLLLAGLLVDPQRAWFSYFAAWTFLTTIGLGALILLMTGHAAKAGWMVVTRRVSEAVASALPLSLILFVPICFGLHHLYAWAAPSAGLHPFVRQAIQHKRLYLNPSFFVVRSLLYFMVFIAVVSRLRAWSRACDERPDLRLVRRMRALSGGGLPAVALVFTWAAFDWTMSLEPAWSSTIFGLYEFAGGFVGAIALVAALLDLTRLRLGSAAAFTADHAQALGRLLFAMVCFWAYMAFSQLLIYWIGNIPDEVSYYRLRTTGSWSAVTSVLVVGHFVVPFFALLNRSLKRRPAYLAVVGAWMLLMHFCDVYWMVMPVHEPTGFRPHWLDIAAVLFVGGLSAAWVARLYFNASPLPLHAPELAKGIHYEAAL